MAMESIRDQFKEFRATTVEGFLTLIRSLKIFLSFLTVCVFHVLYFKLFCASKCKCKGRLLLKHHMFTLYAKANIVIFFSKNSASYGIKMMMEKVMKQKAEQIMVKRLVSFLYSYVFSQTCYLSISFHNFG